MTSNSIINKTRNPLSTFDKLKISCLLSNIIHKYKANNKFATDINKATYLLLRFSFSFDFVKKINRAPIVGNSINEESITNKAIIEKNIKKYIENKEIIKKIYVKDRLLNLIIK